MGNRERVVPPPPPPPPHLPVCPGFDARPRRHMVRHMSVEILVRTRI